MRSSGPCEGWFGKSWEGEGRTWLVMSWSGQDVVEGTCGPPPPTTAARVPIVLSPCCRWLVQPPEQMAPFVCSQWLVYGSHGHICHSRCYGAPSSKIGHSSTSHIPDATTSQLFCFHSSLCLQPPTNTWRAQVKPQVGPPPAAVTSSGLTPVPAA